ncbi:unnamed protein product [Arabis nemorensis]|uniref:Uncharacterized protein n=1 Tax=Arabis nemorensis TaxID=586526 RepID=A0A565AZB2_9BRAS|nr:unnamed protein product [Arabis nemorensis]
MEKLEEAQVYLDVAQPDVTQPPPRDLEIQPEVAQPPPTDQGIQREVALQMISEMKLQVYETICHLIC